MDNCWFNIGNVSNDAKLGQHLRTLRVPGTTLRSLTWEGSGLRLALAVDSHIFFANVRPTYVWDYFGKTLVYASYRKDRSDFTIHFWNTDRIMGSTSSGSGGAAPTGSPEGGGGGAAGPAAQASIQTKTLRHVQAIASHGEMCAIVCKAGDNGVGADGGGATLVVHLCNELGATTEKREINFYAKAQTLTGGALMDITGGGGGAAGRKMSTEGAPFEIQVKSVAMTETYVIVATADSIYLWNFTGKKQETMFHIGSKAGPVEKEQYCRDFKPAEGGRSFLFYMSLGGTDTSPIPIAKNSFD